MPDAVRKGERVMGGTGLLTEGMKTAFSNAIDGIQSDVISMITVALPAGLAIMGIRLAVSIGVGFFRTVAS